MERRKPDWIAYVGLFVFPWGQAGSRRVYGMARSLVKAGYSVVVGGGDADPLSPVQLDCNGDAGSLYYVGLGEWPSEDAYRPAKLVRYLVTHGKRTLRWLNSQRVKPSHVILYGLSVPYLIRLLPWCRRNKVRLLVDVVEWYDPSQEPGGHLGPFYVNISTAIRYLVPRSDGIIAISSYLGTYYRRRGCSVLRVPPTLDVENTPAHIEMLETGDHPLTLVYAGNPGRKDLLSAVIHGINMVDPHGDHARLLVCGPTQEHVRHLLDSGEELPPSVQVLGRLPQHGVLKVIEQADFSVLLRPPLRYAQAGFPTKFVESMASAIPVIANITSDLGEYLRDGVEGIVCRDHSAEAFAEALERALSLTHEQRRNMRQEARRQAEQSFDYRIYAEPLAAFLRELQL